MSQTIKFQDIRTVSQHCHPFNQFRPSGNIRVVKGTLQCTVMLTALSYGLNFHGYGLHSYFLQKIGKIKPLAPWMRTKTFFTLFGKYSLLTLPFFYLKQVAYSFIDSETKTKPHVRNKVNYAFINNLMAATACYPLSYLLFNRKLMKGLRSSLFLCTFSMANDLFIEFRRKKYIEMNFTPEQLHEISMKKKVEDIKGQLSELLAMEGLSQQKKRDLRKLDIKQIQQQLMKYKEPISNQEMQTVRVQQMRALSEALSQQFKSYRHLFDRFK